ncbi:MAG: hypothetical protein ACKVPX_07105 [Myxococcaceae bacterium]
MDLSILDADGVPGQTLTIGAGLHERLMSAADLAGAKLMGRMADFYADADYSQDELQGLHEDVTSVARTVNHDPELSTLLERMGGLVESAQLLGRSVAVIAD